LPPSGTLGAMTTTGARAGPGLVRDPLARVPVITAMVALLIVLAVLAPEYGYHRDELYFRMLPPAWGYTDQPPLTPLLARAAIAVFGDSVVALRVVPLICAVASLPVLALITREVGGSRRAQALTAWGMAGATLTLQFGHLLLTASLDLVVWPAALLCAIRAVTREDGRWWLVARGGDRAELSEHAAGGDSGRVTHPGSACVGLAAQAPARSSRTCWSHCLACAGSSEVVPSTPRLTALRMSSSVRIGHTCSSRP